MRNFSRSGNVRVREVYKSAGVYCNRVGKLEGRGKSGGTKPLLPGKSLDLELTNSGRGKLLIQGEEIQGGVRDQEPAGGESPSKDKMRAKMTVGLFHDTPEGGEG